MVEARGGAAETEYALFDPGDIELHATEPGAIREMGYRTTVSAARQRLAEAGATPALAEEIRQASVPAVARAYARSAAVRSVVDRFEASELFESPTYDAASGKYVGRWLDLAQLASDVGVARAGALLQAVHLAAVLAELPDDASVFLETAEVTAKRPPGKRTLKRVDLQGVSELPVALRALKPRAREAPDSTPGRLEIVEWARGRATKTAAAKNRLADVEAALSTRQPPTRGPLAETALWNLESKLARGDTTGVLEQVDGLERRRGRTPATIYLRARVALLAGSEDPRNVAERISVLSTSIGNFPELQLLAAQAWARAGDRRRAEAFARDIHENASVDEVLRMQALEVLAGPREAPRPPSANPPRSLSPPPPVDLRPPSDAPTPRSPEVTEAVRDRDAIEHVDIPPAPRPPSGTEIEGEDGNRSAVLAAKPAAPEVTGRGATGRSSGSMRPLPPGTALPAYRVEARGERTWSLPPPEDTIPARGPERVESLSLPPGMEGEPPPTDEAPRNPSAARLVCTYLARDLARELRIRNGVELGSDLDGLETAQRYLREVLADGRIRTPDEERELMRHGAFLSELVARRLDGRWIDVDSRDAGVWAMLVPSRSRPDEVLRVWPFGRVIRFVVMGHKERDLVSYLLELEARAR
ncbi:MAG TPA: hypothetical protein VF765_28165 [Polyangiaceae bacterium]